jgi:hypothetical protein
MDRAGVCIGLAYITSITLLERRSGKVISTFERTMDVYTLGIGRRCEVSTPDHAHSAPMTHDL